MSVKDAFFEVCKDAQPAEAHYVSLYARIPYYGGPEEGGWWGTDYVLVAYHKVGNDAEAEAVRSQVEALAVKLSEDARDSFNRGCAAQCEWLEARGLDDSFLPEVDGPEGYLVWTETRPGEHVSEGDRCYS
ncbi:hypothetical protein [Mycolicibacterium sphagni]|uniref:hypothetical protein n=1 Tax=Mycolicibacterium sphagni TaxID=1786 RepID=UPI0021F3020A|nr:hypothetical protein [Mycolicibacterium sphagni]MCV7174841.1 hypothetical protein [Mycolicibacterium sphagni]